MPLSLGRTQIHTSFILLCYSHLNKASCPFLIFKPPLANTYEPSTPGSELKGSQIQEQPELESNILDPRENLWI